MAHCRDGGRPSWRPVVGVVLPLLWRQGHKGQPTPRQDLPQGEQRPQDRQRAPCSGAAPTGSARGPSGKAGEELPDWIADKKRRAERIREAKAELEAEAKADRCDRDQSRSPSSYYRRTPAIVRRPIWRRWRTATSMPTWRPAGPRTPSPARSKARPPPYRPRQSRLAPPRRRGHACKDQGWRHASPYRLGKQLPEPRTPSLSECVRG
jgi:hypothetical protein